MLAAAMRRQAIKSRSAVNAVLQKLISLAGWRDGARREAEALDIDDAPPVAGFVSATVVPFGLSLAMVAVATAVLFAASDVLPHLNLVSIVYLLPVLVAAARWGLMPALVCAFAGAAGADYFFYPPLYSFEIGDTQNVADLAIFLIIAVVTSSYTARLRRETDNLRRSRKEVRGLYAFSRQLAACFTVPDLIAAAGSYLSETLGHRAVLVDFGEVDRAPSGVPERVWQEAAAMIAAGAGVTRTIGDAGTSNEPNDWLIRVVTVGSAAYAAIVDLGRGSDQDTGVVSRRVDAAIEEAAITLTRLDVATAIEEARLKSRADSLRDALLGTVSNELRTPLASILGSTSVLDQIPAVKEDHRINALVEAVHDQASRLDGDIQNLLSAARITARGLQPHLEWTDPTDIVSAAVKQKAARLAGHRLDLAVGPDLPLVKVNSVLVEQALGQLLENAAKYSPIGSTIRMSGRVDRDRVVLSVTDQGVGLTQDEKRQLGQRSFRGARHLHHVPGAGLGLWIADTFVTTNGGTLDAESRGAGLGTTVSIRLPAGDESEGAAEAMS
jgi:K+-sensing histidine kinase KdpD